MAPLLDFKKYKIAWIAPLPIEAQAALYMLDKIHDGNFPSDAGDDYQYFAGEINGHNIVVASFPPGTPYGGNSAAALASQVKKCFTRLWFGLLVGIAAGLPNHSCEPTCDIRLGDVLVSIPNQENTGVTQYDLGKQTEDGFVNLNRQASTESIVRSAIGRIRALAQLKGYNFLEHLSKVEDKWDEAGTLLFEYPGQDKDHLYAATDQTEELVKRRPRADGLRTRVFYGNIGSGNTLMKSGEERDKLHDRYKLIGLEMEAHGTMETIRVGHIRGVCDYGDKHKNKEWQGYAAAVAAAYAREVLCTINPKNEDDEQSRKFDTILFPRNKNIVLRDSIFKSLDQLLPLDNRPHRAAIWGLGGAGKTQIALEYAYSRKDKMTCSVYWVHASTRARFSDGYKQIATGAGLPADLKETDMLQGVRDWLKKQVNWLLVIDNADDMALFAPKSLESNEDQDPGFAYLLDFIPATAAGTILWTSRDGAIIRNCVGSTEGINVGKMSLVESLNLFRGTNDFLHENEATSDERTILGPACLDGLPLAISQAQVYIATTGVSVSKYLHLFRQSELQILGQDHPDEYRRGVPNSVMRTWRISLNRIADEFPIVVAILKTAAFFDNQGLPFELIKRAATMDMEVKAERPPRSALVLITERSVHHQQQKPQVLSNVAVLEIMSRLVQFSFFRCQRARSKDELPIYEQHRLLQLAMRNSLSTTEAQEFCLKALSTLTEVFPDTTNLENWDLCKSYLPHGLKALQGGALLNTHSIPLLDTMAYYTLNQGIYTEAVRCYSQQLQCEEVISGTQQNSCLSTLGNLSLALYLAGEYEEAETKSINLVKAIHRSFGLKHTKALLAMSILSDIWAHQGKDNKAKQLNEKILEIYQNNPDCFYQHNLVLITYIAGISQFLEDYATAETLYQDVINENKKLGCKNADTMNDMYNLANTWWKMGKVDKAEELVLQLLDDRRNVSGEKHPETTISMHLLAVIWLKKGNLDAAQSLLVRTVELSIEVFGAISPQTLRMKYDLAVILNTQGKQAEAEEVMAEVVDLRTKKLGRGHPDVQDSLYFLVDIYQANDREEEADTLLDELETIKAEENPKARLNNKTDILEELGIGDLGIDYPETPKRLVTRKRSVTKKFCRQIFAGFKTRAL